MGKKLLLRGDIWSSKVINTLSDLLSGDGASLTLDAILNLTAGAIPFGSATGGLSSDASNLFWDDTNDRLGVGTNSPSTATHVVTTTGAVLKAEQNATGTIPTLLTLYNNQTDSAATGDGGNFVFSVNNDAGTEKNIAGILAKYNTVTDGAEDGVLTFRVIGGGSVTEKARVDHAGNFGFNGQESFGTGAAGVIGLANGTAPSDSPTDMVQIWSEDRDGGADDAAIHWRVEDGNAVGVFGFHSGFGTASPDTNHVLTVSGDGGRGILLTSSSNANLELNAASTSFDSNIRFSAGGTIQGQIVYDHNASGADEKLRFLVGAEQLRIDGLGNIGLNGQTTWGTSAAGVLAIKGGTAPSTSPADAFQLWVEDRGAVAGEAGLHWRSEGGDVGVIGDLSGFGTATPVESIHTTGAILIGTAVGTTDGTIRWTGTDFEGRKGGAWVSFTAAAAGGDFSDGGDLAGADRTLGNTDAFDLGFITNNLVRIHIQSDGLVGFGGLTAPQNQIHAFANDTSTTALINIEQDGTGDAALTFELTALQSFTMGVDNSSSDMFSISDGTDLSTNIRFTIDGSGNIGLGANQWGTSAAGVIAVQNGTAPSTSIGDVTQLWSADRAATAGEASLHYRSETGEVGIIGSRVGFGTATPSTYFEVDAGSNNTIGKVKTTGNGQFSLEGNRPFFDFVDKDSATTTYRIQHNGGEGTYPNDLTIQFVDGVTNPIRGIIDENGNWGFNTPTEFGSGSGVLGIADAGTNPSANPTGGGVLYSDAGAGKWRGSGGTTTTFGPAEPHCTRCGKDFVLEWDNPDTGHLIVCLWCMSKDDHLPWVVEREEREAYA
jgi:hypothetical protein